jgi:hypothetical protein
VVSSRDGDGEVLTSCASQNMVFGGSEAQVGGLRDREGLARSVDACGEVKVGLGEGEARTGRRRATSKCVPRTR